MHECFPKHPRMGTARYKLDNKTEEEGKKRRINVERSTANTKERSPVQSPCRVVTSVTHDSQSRSPPPTWYSNMLNWWYVAIYWTHAICISAVRVAFLGLIDRSALRFTFKLVFHKQLIKYTQRHLLKNILHYAAHTDLNFIRRVTEKKIKFHIYSRLLRSRKWRQKYSYIYSYKDKNTYTSTGV